jgi:hypothetical protein
MNCTHAFVPVTDNPPFRYEQCVDCGTRRCNHEYQIHYGYGVDVCVHCGGMRARAPSGPGMHRNDFSD